MMEAHLKIGLFGVGLQEYWLQYEGLQQRLSGHIDLVAEKLSYFGWYNNYYYPGTGYYVYDTYRRPHVMTTTQRQYWSSRSPALRTTTRTVRVQPNWSGFNRRATAHSTRADRKAAREERRLERQTRRNNRDD